MISNNQLKVFSSLKSKKYREIHKLFLAEGEKIVIDILQAKSRLFKISGLIAETEFLKNLPSKFSENIPSVYEVNSSVISRISSFSTPNKAILVCEIPELQPDFSEITSDLSLFLDDIRDPGNLGTIIRTADWFGIRNIFCSNESVDVYNPKVIQSTMGAICRVKVLYNDSDQFFPDLRKHNRIKIMGTVLNGENIYETDLPSGGMIVLGNEAHGISPKVIDLLDMKLTIPTKGNTDEVSESLNVATAAAIIMAEFRRRQGFYSK